MLDDLENSTFTFTTRFPCKASGVVAANQSNILFMH